MSDVNETTQIQSELVVINFDPILHSTIVQKFRNLIALNLVSFFISFLL